MSRVIVVTSGKGGVGKSSSCVNIGSNLANNGYKVCLIDADLGLKNLDVIFTEWNSSDLISQTTKKAKKKK